MAILSLSSSTSAIRRRVPRVVSSGKAVVSKKPQATISWLGSGSRSCAELPDHVDRDVVPAGYMAVEEQAVQLGIAGQFDPPLLRQFAPQRIAKVWPTSTPPPGRCQPAT